MSRQQSSASSPRGDTTKGRPLIKCFVVGESSSDAYLFDLLRKYSKPSRAVTVGAGGSAHQSPAMTDEDEASALPTTLTITVMGQKSNDGNQCSPLTKATASEVSGYDLGGVDVAFHRNGSREMRYGCAKEAGSVVLAMTPFGDQQYEEYKTASHMCDLLFESCGSMGGGGSPILVNFGEKQPVFTCDVPGNSYPINVTLLGLAVGIQAGYVFKSLSEPSEETITKLIDAIVLTSQSYRLDFSRECMITSSLFLEEEEATFPQEGLIGVSKMSCSHVRSLLHLLSSNFKTNATEHAYCKLLRLWAGAGNWPAVDELVFSNHLVKAEVDMWNTVIPHQFEGLACQVLRCLRPENNGIPEWKLRSRVGAVFFRENQPTYLVRKSDTPPQWPFIKLFLLFGEEPMPSEPTHQIVALGGPHLHRAALLKCLMENKAKATVRLTKLPTTTAPVVQVHTPFQLSNKQWTAWDLGGGTQEEWNPFYPCFFFSDSVFLLVFDASASSSTISAHHPELPKLHFLLNQISSCHHHKKKASCYRPHSQKPKVVLVGIQTSNPLDPDAPSSLNDLYQTARKHWEKNIDFLDFYTVNLESGESLHLRDSSSVLERMVKCLQRNTTRPYVVPQTWARLRSSLGGINNKGALKWLQLVRLAHSCGVGRTTSQISQAAQRDEIRLCFDWLSDIGSIFHFRHRYFQESSSQRGYNDGLVVLDPSWFNSLYNLTLSMNKEITNPTSVPSHTPPKAVDPSVAESLESLMQRFTTKKMADHLGPAERVVLSKLGLLMTTTSPKNPEFFPFFVLPSTPPGSVGDQLLGLSGFRENGTVSGCVLQFEFLPSESFTAVMRELCFIPGVHILMCWRDGILLSKYTTVPQKRSSDVKELEVQGEARLLMTRHNQAASVGGAPHTRVEVTITAVPPFGFKILATALDFLSKITGVMVVQHSFICPMCFLMHLKSSGGFQMPTAAESEFKNYFTMTQMTEAAGRDPSTLECEKHGSLEVDDIAPGLLLHTFTHDSEGAGVPRFRATRAVGQNASNAAEEEDSEGRCTGTEAFAQPDSSCFSRRHSHWNCLDYFIGCKGISNLCKDYRPKSNCPLTQWKWATNNHHQKQKYRDEPRSNQPTAGGTGPTRIH
ncbi:hypothetical protein Pelo_17951 [Pelomyxa schiedti]|nr:hypothetical protein Pelo_17951 [Pelomyxa schiedti]